MAAFANMDSDTMLDLDKLASVPPFCPDKVFEYKVSKGLETELVVMASSTFEAATKFAFWAADVGLLQSSANELSNNATTVAVITPENDQYVYNIMIADNQPVVELDHYVKNSSFLDDNSTDISSDVRQLSSNIEVDLETGEMIDNTLKHYFGFTSFRSLQRETIVATMSKKDVMTVVGTGGGKSLTYLLPAVLSSKPTLVISPIKSLIDDILGRCQSLNISSCKFTGDITKQMHDSQLLNLQNFKIIIVTPEILHKGEFMDKIMSFAEKSQLERIVFDEAHTIVNWGSTFRPVYKEVCEHLGKVSNCPKLLLSATVPAKLESELKAIFTDLTVFRSSVFRENLHLNVRERGNKFYDDLEKFLLDHQKDCGIIYCVLPKDVSTVHAELLKRGIDCVKYHGQLSEDVKVVNHSKWMNGECKLIVANSSFGMGIDKKDVRYVVHARIPTSIDEYYQQCGRAGRDGLPAKCVLFYKYTDKNTLFKLFQKQGDIANQMSSVNELINFLEDTIQCRHKCIMLYFGEERNSFLCGTACDNCTEHGGFHLTDGTSDALKVVQAVVELTGKALTCNILKLFLSGSRQKLIQDQGLDSFSNFGILQKQFVPVLLLEKFLHSLIYHGILAEVPQKKGKSVFLTLVLGPLAHNLLALNIDVTRYEKK